MVPDLLEVIKQLCHEPRGKDGNLFASIPWGTEDESDEASQEPPPSPGHRRRIPPCNPAYLIAVRFSATNRR
jgi:hypothetical protein